MDRQNTNCSTDPPTDGSDSDTSGANPLTDLIQMMNTFHINGSNVDFRSKNSCHLANNSNNGLSLGIASQNCLNSGNYSANDFNSRNGSNFRPNNGFSFSSSTDDELNYENHKQNKSNDSFHSKTDTNGFSNSFGLDLGFGVSDGNALQISAGATFNVTTIPRPILKQTNASNHLQTLDSCWYEDYRQHRRHVHFDNPQHLDHNKPPDPNNNCLSDSTASALTGRFGTTKTNSDPNGSHNDLWNPIVNSIKNTVLNKSSQQWMSSMNRFGISANIWSSTGNWNNSSATAIPSKMSQIFANNRRNSGKAQASYTWSGQLPRKSRTKNPIYSCKVFLGGIPYDLTDSDLHCTFAKFGHIQIQWPGKDIKSAIGSATANKAGYVYIIFEGYDNVANLLSNCTLSYRDADNPFRWYYNITSRRQKEKEVQIIPFDIGDRFYMKTNFSGQMDTSRTVFVGALHGMLSADGLAKVMDDLFGGVVFAGLDTDKHKYPLGSGRVTFDNQDSYLKAVSANFVEIKSNRFKKKIQIDPYIENESICHYCQKPQQSPIFCRDDFLYFCEECWGLHLSDPLNEKHRPIIKSKTTANSDRD